MADQRDANPSGERDETQGPPEEAAQPSSAAPLPDAPGDVPAVEDFSERLQQGGHVVICNWNSKGEAIVRELHSGVVRDKRLVVIVTDKRLPKRVGEMWRGVFGVDGNPLEHEFLLQAMITKAHSAIILADEENPNPDTTNFMLAASIERINPNVHTIVEISESSYLEHFQGTGVDEMICVNEIAEKIISQSCLTPGLSALYLRLLTASEDTNEIYILPAPETAQGHTYRDVRRAIGTFEGESLVLLGFLAHVEGLQATSMHRTFERNGKRMTMIVNPIQNSQEGDSYSQDYVIRPDDELILMAYEEPHLRGFRVERAPRA
jgi:Trk K+ transport system NAD-binding subunit